MAFHDVQLPIDYERGAIGGPRFSTTISTNRSGREVRNQNWLVEQGSWDIGYGVQTLADYRVVAAFFRQRNGRLHSFRFRDWADYQAEDEPSGQWRQVGSQVQLRKTYDSYIRVITHPATIVLKRGGVVIAEDKYTIDKTTGVVTFTEAPVGGTQAVTWSGEFDIAVRFDMDRIETNVLLAEGEGAAEIPSIPLREVKQELARDSEGRTIGSDGVPITIPCIPVNRISEEYSWPLPAEWEIVYPNNGYSVSMRNTLIAVSSLVRIESLPTRNKNGVYLQRLDVETGNPIGDRIGVGPLSTRFVLDMYGDWVCLSGQTGTNRGIPEVNINTGVIRWWWNRSRADSRGNPNPGGSAPNFGWIVRPLAAAFHPANYFVRYSRDVCPFSRMMVLGTRQSSTLDNNQTPVYVFYDYWPVRDGTPVPEPNVVAVNDILAGGTQIVPEAASKWGYLYGAVTATTLSIQRRYLITNARGEPERVETDSQQLVPSDFGATSFVVLGTDNITAAIKYVGYTNQIAVFANTDVGVRMLTLNPFDMSISDHDPVSLPDMPEDNFFYHATIGDKLIFNYSGGSIEDIIYSFHCREFHPLSGTLGDRPESVRNLNNPRRGSFHNGSEDRNLLRPRARGANLITWINPLWISRNEVIGAIPPDSPTIISKTPVRLDSSYARGAVGGPGFETNIAEARNKAELRKANYSQERGRWEIGYSERSLVELKRITDFFRARGGRVQGFLFRDWTDYQAINDHIGRWSEDGDTLQLRRVYGATGLEYFRDIKRPQIDTISVAVSSDNGAAIPLDDSAYSVDPNTGILTFGEAPTIPPGAVNDYLDVYWSGVFDLAARFDTDALDVRVTGVNKASIGSLAVVELVE